MSTGTFRDVEFKALTEVTMKIYILLGIMPCSSMKVIRRFGGTYWLHHKFRRVSQAKKSLLHDDFLLDLLFDPEDGRDM
jgi:hypothetical protein